MTLKRFFILIFAATIIFACGKEPQKEAVKIVTTNITVPSSIEIEEGQDITLQLRGTTNITKDNRIVLRNAAGEDITCTISDLKDGDHLTFSVPEGTVSGYYKLYVKADGANNYAGAFDLVIIAPLKIEPDADTNIYGIVQCDGVGIPGVLVSDGDLIVETDANGIYQMRSQKKWSYVFVIIPSGYEVPRDGILPQFH